MHKFWSLLPEMNSIVDLFSEVGLCVIAMRNCSCFHYLYMSWSNAVKLQQTVWKIKIIRVFCLYVWVFYGLETLVKYWQEHRVFSPRVRLTKATVSLSCSKYCDPNLILKALWESSLFHFFCCHYEYSLVYCLTRRGR